jgi:hypothetical protein
VHSVPVLYGIFKLFSRLWEWQLSHEFNARCTLSWTYIIPVFGYLPRLHYRSNMRLLHTSRLVVEHFIERKSEATLVSSEHDAVPEYAVPRYVILSHTWEEEEVTFIDMYGDRELATAKKGWKKLQAACDEARSNGYDWIWVDTCCIDKASSAELSEAINSMFRWYENSAVCYVYLSDAYGTQPVYIGDNWASEEHVKPRWYSRGWTLQELIAPRHVRFYVRDWRFVGTKEEYLRKIYESTGIDIYALEGGDLLRMSVARRMTWLADRETTRIEDLAYCMLGIFDINMPLLYGEGAKAFTRLQEEIMKSTEDQSLFAWREHDSLDYYREDYGDAYERSGLLADAPRLFTSSKSISMFPWLRPSRPLPVSTRQGLQLQVLLCQDTSYLSGEVFLALLDCQIGKTPGVFAGIRLRRVSEERYVRVDPTQLLQFARLDQGGHVILSGFNPTEEQKELFDISFRMFSLHLSLLNLANKVNLDTSHKSWKPKWVYVSQSAQPPLPSSFWFVPQAGIRVVGVTPIHLWDRETMILQPLASPFSTNQTGGVEIKVHGVRMFLIFGFFVEPLCVQPWCEVIDLLSDSETLLQAFNTYWTRPQQINANVKAAVEKMEVSGTYMYIVKVSTRRSVALSE